eukprot:scaffold23281_cov120-Isochrysis_galbana.AAC.4
MTDGNRRTRPGSDRISRAIASGYPASTQQSEVRLFSSSVSSVRSASSANESPRSPSLVPESA